MSSSNCCFLTCIQTSQEAGQVVCYSHLLKNFAQFIMIHIDKGFSAVNEAEVDVFLVFSCFFNEPTAAKLLQLCLTLCNPIGGSPPGSPVSGILQARTLEWVAISFSNAWKWKVKVKSLSRFWLLVTPWTAAYQAPASTGFSRQEYWSGVPLPSWNEPTDVGNLISGSSAFSKSSLKLDSWFTYCWCLAWRILNVTLLVCEMSAIVQ